jgi:hypothetical protein
VEVKKKWIKIESPNIERKSEGSGSEKSA